MNPYYSLPLTIGLGLMLILIMLWLSWQATPLLSLPRRGMLLVLRTLGALTLLLLFLNPGKWVQPIAEHESGWQVLIDQSASMAEPDARTKSNAEATRWEHALALQEEFQSAAIQADFPIETRTFGGRLNAAVSDLTTLTPDQDASQLALSTRTLLDTRGSGGFPVAGVLVLSDGRQTTRAPIDPILLSTARAHATPIHTFTLGGQVSPPDLSVACDQHLVTSFAEQNLSIPVHLESLGLPAQRLHLTLTDSEGIVLAEQKLDHPGESKITTTLRTTAPSESTILRLSLAPMEGETRKDNNELSLHIRIIDSKTKVLLVEGSPYWDSKFLSQMLRRQEYISIRAIYRLSSERFFQVSSDDNNPSQSKTAIFPDTLKELSTYDLVVLGKNIEPFLTAERLELLKRFVHEQGGALLFSRGKAYSGDFPGLAPLEPVKWSVGRTQNFRLMPARDGETSGLFGQALPAQSDPIWSQLPPLQDAYTVDSLNPFSRVLAEGAISGTQQRFPALVVRRYGQGVTGVMNADGLWQWDFYPEAREHGNMYLDFWSELLQWMASYSEFLPGHDYSLLLSQSRLEAGETVGLSLAYRGAVPPSPQVEITLPDGTVSQLTPARVPELSRPEWRATYRAEQPGSYTIAVTDPIVASSMPVSLLTVPHPPQEQDDLSADPVYMQEVAEQTGGQALTVETWGQFLKNLETHTASAQLEAPPNWEPRLHHWAYGLLIALIFSLEWWLRRRHGLS